MYLSIFYISLLTKGFPSFIDFILWANRLFLGDYLCKPLDYFKMNFTIKPNHPRCFGNTLIIDVLVIQWELISGLLQVDVAFLRAARAGNLEKVLNFLNEDGDINTCNAVSIH